MATESDAEARRTFFRALRCDLAAEPPKMNSAETLVKAFVEGLCRFVPSREDLQKEIRQDFSVDVSLDNGPIIAEALLKWISKFQAPVHDSRVEAMRQALRQGESVDDYVDFLEAFYDHSSLCYEEVEAAKQRVRAGESPVPPQHRTQGTNGVPDHIRSGRR